MEIERKCATCKWQGFEDFRKIQCINEDSYRHMDVMSSWNGCDKWEVDESVVKYMNDRKAGNA